MYYLQLDGDCKWGPFSILENAEKALLEVLRNNKHWSGYIVRSDNDFK